MRLDRFIERLLIEVPSIGTTGSGATAAQLTGILNEAVDQVNILTKIYKGYTDFNIAAEKQIYNLSEFVPTFLGMAKAGVFFKDANDDWTPVYPKTYAWIAKTYPSFLNAASAAVPLWYWQEGDELGFYQKPSTTIASGCRIHHLKAATPMAADASYPFTGTTTEIKALLPLDDAILAYVRWKFAPAFGKVTDIDMREREFLKECRKGARAINRRPDMTIDSEYGIKL